MSNTPFKMKGITPLKHLIGKHPSKKDGHVRADHEKKKKQLTEEEYNKEFYKFIHTGGGSRGAGIAPDDPSGWQFRGDLISPEDFSGLKGKFRKSKTGVYDSAHQEPKWWKVKRR